MYLCYDEYVSMGGALDASAFHMYGRRAEKILNAQAGGQTGRRIGKIINAGEGVPCAVKDCIFELVEFLSVNSPQTKQVASESQTLGGQSENISYVTLTKEQIKAECSDIIYNSIFGGGMGELLYGGACDA